MDYSLIQKKPNMRPTSSMLLLFVFALLPFYNGCGEAQQEYQASNTPALIPLPRQIEWSDADFHFGKF